MSTDIAAIDLGYFTAIFLAFFGISYSVFHSFPALKLFVLAALASTVSLLHGVNNRTEYRLTSADLEQRYYNR
ncbi:MAG: hypothetical protein H6696_06535 [Deferribacteres bacterium]|nr:hypothetical protein [candidate division KSB1 bacterium]MCB9501577.1 hypothetical protein [Deferribacteres bacterium]